MGTTALGASLGYGAGNLMGRKVPGAVGAALGAGAGLVAGAGFLQDAMRKKQMQTTLEEVPIKDYIARFGKEELPPELFEKYDIDALYNRTNDTEERGMITKIGAETALGAPYVYTDRVFYGKDIPAAERTAKGSLGALGMVTGAGIGHKIGKRFGGARGSHGGVGALLGAGAAAYGTRGFLRDALMGKEKLRIRDETPLQDYVKRHGVDPLDYDVDNLAGIRWRNEGRGL